MVDVGRLEQQREGLHRLAGQQQLRSQIVHELGEARSAHRLQRDLVVVGDAVVGRDRQRRHHFRVLLQGLVEVHRGNRGLTCKINKKTSYNTSHLSKTKHVERIIDAKKTKSTLK